MSARTVHSSVCREQNLSRLVRQHGTNQRVQAIILTARVPGLGNRGFHGGKSGA